MTGNHYLLILAAGKGTRMHSPKPKVLHTLLGEPMLTLVLEATESIFGNRIFIVAGHGYEEVAKLYPNHGLIHQRDQLGTGHALKVAMPALLEAGAERVTVINGDCPLLSQETLAVFLDKASASDLAFASIQLEDAASYGRVVRNGGKLVGIVEAKDYSTEIFGTATGEVNAGIYDCNISSIEPLMNHLRNDNANGEYYITDLVKLGLASGLTVAGILLDDPDALLGVNSPRELALAEELLAARINGKLLDSGVCLHTPATLFISPLVKIEPGADIIGPGHIIGKTIIRSGSTIGPFCVIRDSEIDGARIEAFSHLDQAYVGSDARVGPYARLRPGAHLEKASHVGNFVELKKARLGAGAKANHLSYLGDAQIGAGANIGAGTITCNYDGLHKHNTSIGEHAFIGSNTALVAPVTIGENAVVGAGSTITKDVPPKELGIARAKQINLPWRKQ